MATATAAGFDSSVLPYLAARLVASTPADSDTSHDSICYGCSGYVYWAWSDGCGLGNSGYTDSEFICGSDFLFLLCLVCPQERQLQLQYIISI